MKKAEIDLLEALAAIEHEQWMSWAKAVIRKEPMSKATQIRWESYFVPYNQLTEEVKEQDRIYAKKVLAELKRLNII